MPVTPFHFGPGAALYAIAPKRVSFLAFCSANVLIDFESLYNLVTHQYPVHRFLHTYIGATLAAIAIVLLFRGARRVAPRMRLPDLFRWQELTLAQVVVGAALGAWSHVLLDSIMHPDMAPLAPFSHANTALGVVSLSVLHWFCVASAVIALLVLGIRRLMKPR
jgi:hypothetical protein